MDKEAKEKLEAALLIAVGGARMASGLAMAGGRGLIGAAMKHNGHMQQAMVLGVQSVKAGKKSLDAGVAQWKAASSATRKGGAK